MPHIGTCLQARERARAAELNGMPVTGAIVHPSLAWGNRQEACSRHTSSGLCQGVTTWFAPLVTTVSAGGPSAESFDRPPPRHPDPAGPGARSLVAQSADSFSALTSAKFHG